MRGGDIFSDYSGWARKYATVTNQDRCAILDHIRNLVRLPRFSLVLLPRSSDDFGPPDGLVKSLLHQLYPQWELWIAADVEAIQPEEPARIRTIPGSEIRSFDPGSLFNEAMQFAEGEYILPVLPEVELSEDALYELAVAAEREAFGDIFYTDEDHIDRDGARCRPRFKTAWDPELALGRDPVGMLVAYRKELLEEIGGMSPRPDADIALYDLALRATSTARPGGVHHIPAVLCHRGPSRAAFPSRYMESTRQAVQEWLGRNDVRAKVVPASLNPVWNRVIRDTPDPLPTVSVIVPTRDRSELLERCADGVLRRTNYSPLELIIVDNDSRERATTELLEKLAEDPRVRIISVPGTFNYPALNNIAAHQATGEILLLLNNDIDVIEPDWLREMVSHAVRPEIGAVGAKLLYADGRVQHAGVVMGPQMTLVHKLRLADRADVGPFGELALTREVSAVTGACLALRRSVFFEVGGLDENLRVAFNDIDLCLRIGNHGYRIVWTPFAELFHLESASRGYDQESPEKQELAAKEACYFSRFWRSLLDDDPFHNPNIIYRWDGTVLADPPRRRKPWQKLT